MNLFIQQLTCSVALNLAAAFFGVISAWFIGRMSLLHICRVKHSAWLAEFVVGCNVAALLGMPGAYMLGRLPSWANLSLLALPAAGALLLAWRRRAEFIAYWRDNVVFAVILTVYFAFMLGAALFPAYNWDEQTYQLALPVRFLQENSPAVLPDNPYSAFPLLLQFVLIWPLAAGGVGAAKIFSLLCYLVLAWGIYDIVRRYSPAYGKCGDRLSAMVCSAVFLLSPLTGAMIRVVYAESLLSLELLAALTVLQRDCGKRDTALQCGIFAGGATAVKLSGLGAVALIVLCAGERKLRSAGWGIFAAAAAVAGALFYLRPLLATGNPFYPFAAAWFGTSRAVESFHHAMGSFYYGMDGFYGVLFAWLFAAFDGRIFDGITLGVSYLFTLGLSVAALLKIRFGNTGDAPENARVAAHLRLMACGALLFYLFWVMTSQQTRFLLPLLCLLCVMAALALRLLLRGRKILTALLLLSAIAGCDRIEVMHNIRAWKMATVARSNSAALLGHAMHDQDFVNILTAVGKTPPDSRILLVFERRALYVPRRSFIGIPDFQEWIFSALPRDPDALLHELRIRKIDFCLIGASLRNPDHLEKYNDVNAALAKLFIQLLRRHDMTLHADSGAYSLLKITK